MRGRLFVVPKISGLVRAFILYKLQKMENYKEKLPRYLMHEAENKRGELAHAIKEYKDCIEILQSIKRTHKKDGSDFQNLRKNFETPESVRLGRWFCVYTKYTEISARRNGELHKIQLEYHNAEDEPTADEIEAEIKKHIEKYKGRLADAENDAQKFDGEVDELTKITEKLGEFLDKLESGNDYKLREILKKAL